MSNVNATPAVLEQLPAGGNPSAPASGTYGEKAEEARLLASLPGEGSPEQADQVAPLPSMGGTPPLPPPAAGLPRSIFGPSRQPGVPASTPLTPMEPEASVPQSQVLQIFEMLAADPERKYSATTRRFAQMIMESIRK